MDRAIPRDANSVTVARLLLDHGADPNSNPGTINRDRWPYPAIWNAFQRENMAVTNATLTDLSVGQPLSGPEFQTTPRDGPP